MMEKLIPKFTKEKPHDPSISRTDHAIEWFKLNRDLKFDTDKTIVQAGFLTIFTL